MSAVRGKNAEAAGGGFTEKIKPALLRLEDVGPGGLYQDGESLIKLVIVAEYLHREGVPFHVALIPRFVVPQKGYDVSIGDDTPYARDFVGTIKKMQELGGIVGIHGYTHQAGNAVSGNGFEFYDYSKNPDVPNTYEFARDRMSMALSLFEKAGIVPGFWETPHYTASMEQYTAFEEQAGLLYEKYYRSEPADSYRVFDRSSADVRGLVTVPTPLGYIGGDASNEKMLKYLDRVKEKQLASFFYHPFREFPFIHRKEGPDGEVRYVYDENSPLHTLINSFRSRGYTFVSVYSLAGFIPAQRSSQFAFSRGDRIIAGRFQEKGKQDLLVWSKSDDSWRLFEYTPRSHIPRKADAFSGRGLWLAGLQAGQGAEALAADFNGDGRDDLVLFNPLNGLLLMAENAGGRLVPLPGPALELEKMIRPRVMPGDFNGDGLADLAFYDRENNRVGVAISTGRGFTGTAWQYIDLLKNDGQKPVCGDFNGDSRSDIAVIDGRNGEWRILLTGSSGGFIVAKKPWMINWTPGGDWQPIAADVDGNGKCDIVVYDHSGYWLVALSDGGRFIRKGEFGPWGTSRKGVPLVADFNGDGRADLAILDGSRDKGYNLDVALSVSDWKL